MNEVWVGEATAKLSSLESRLAHFEEVCAACRLGQVQNTNGLREHFDEKFDRMQTQLTNVRLQVAWMSGAAAMIGAVVGAFASKYVG